MDLNNVLIHAREMRFADKKDEDLHQMLIVCGNYTGQTVDAYSVAQIRHATQAIQEELAARQRAKNHQEAIEKSGVLHGKTLEEFGKLKVAVDLVKTSIDGLERPRWIQWAILIVGTIAAIATVIDLFRGH